MTGHPAQTRTILTLVTSQTMGALGQGAGVTVGAILAADLSGSEALAGFGGTAQVLGSAIFAVIIAGIMAKRGRRPGLRTGYLLATLGGLGMIAAAVFGNFPLLILASLLLGAGTATNSQARFAATDLSADERRGRDLSLVVWATTVGAVAGPNLTGPGADIADVLGLPPLAGPFVLAIAGFVLAAAVLQIFLRPDPLLVARAQHVDHDEPGRTRGGVRQGLRTIRAHPFAVTGLAVMALGHATMVALMIMTPLHMRHGHAELHVIGLTISLHIAGMYALSPVTGWAVDRLGARAVAVTGSCILLVAAISAGISPDGSSLPLTAGLVLLGLGWSCTLVSGSTLLTQVIPLRDRPAAQGVADLVMGLTAAAGGALAGVVFDRLGYAVLAVAVGLLAALVGVVALRHREGPRPAG